MDLLLHHTSIIPAPSVLSVHHSQAREALGGLFLLTKGILLQDLAVGWLDNYIATASSITLRLAPAAVLENVAPHIGAAPARAGKCNPRIGGAPARAHMHSVAHPIAVAIHELQRRQ